MNESNMATDMYLDISRLTSLTTVTSHTKTNPRTFTGAQGPSCSCFELASLRSTTPRATKCPTKKPVFLLLHRRKPACSRGQLRGQEGPTAGNKDSGHPQSQVLLIRTSPTLQTERRRCLKGRRRHAEA